MFFTPGKMAREIDSAAPKIPDQSRDTRLSFPYAKLNNAGEVRGLSPPIHH
jgi:hypothetical protein